MVLMHSGEGVKINRNNLIDVENGEFDGTASTSLVPQIVQVLKERDSKWILGLITYNIVILYYLCSWVTSTNSIALSAYANTIFFNVFALLVCLVSVWVEKNSPANRHFRHEPRPLSIFGDSRLPKTLGYQEYRKSFELQLRATLKQFGNAKFDNYTRQDGPESREKVGKNERFEDEGNETRDHESITSLGLEKYEVLALLVSSCLSLMAGSLVSVQVVARLSDQPSVHTGRLGLGVLLGFLAHLGTIIGYPDAGLNHVVCKALPCPTLRGCNPILGGNMISALILSGTHLVIHFWEIHTTDTAAAFAVLGLTATSMLPLAFYTLNVILQKLPRHMSEQLDKCLREALIIDGVLEFRNERFWTKSFGKLAGSLEVRIRRNANENDVLESVMKRLSRIVSTLSIEEFREPRAIDVFGDHPVEYYINEILSPFDGSIDDSSSHRENNRASNREIEVGIVRIEDIIGVEDSRIETFAIKSREIKISSDQRYEERPDDVGADKKSTSNTLTIYKNDYVNLRDRIWRGHLTRKNALLFGTKNDFEKFKHFLVPDRHYNGTNKIIT